ncbi:abortive infection family protein [Chryseobacterium lathyri]|uniref:Uncharacterized protein YqgV (UPF0045/DUF77 family) n=1 Tax=Chryseobacterium lathyri TaxID=395933 RepID=A0ABT9SLH1_9FLAO|nr:abortive infection family protein [Chryseobacterium lathyri]MDP9959280.1 uncharacterized protein YqgV (UPF0045/DUF77 family) [Chryseobacterium lathyri]
MKISKKITKSLGKLIAGDTGIAPYMSGPELVEFYNEYDFDDEYGQGFPSRWVYSTDKITESNGSLKLQKILEDFVDPRRFIGTEKKVEIVVDEVNKLIKIDGYTLVKNGELYKVTDTHGNFIQEENLTVIGHEFIREQIEKCQQKIRSEDYNGAITNARTLIEAVLIYIVEYIQKTEVKNDGNLLNLYSRAKKALKIDYKKDEIPDSAFQILSGLDSIISGLSGFSNNAGDRNANRFNTKRHHAKLVVNSAMTACDFLVDVLNEKKTVD